MLFEFLPTEYKMRARKLYRGRLLILFTTGILFVAVSSIILLVPSYIIARIEKGLITKERDVAIETLAIKENDTTKSLITSAKAKIEKADSVLREKSFMRSLEELIGNNIDGIDITNIVFKRELKGNNIILSGTSRNRDTLLLLVKSLEETRLFGSVDLPVSNLAKSINIDFSINLIEIPKNI